MRYEHVVRYVAETPWAILPAKLEEIVGVLAFRSSGGTFTPEEIAARIGDAASRPTAPATQGAIAVIPIHGTIAHRMGGMSESSGGISAERIGLMMRQAYADPAVTAIVLDINSPGGTVAGMPELADELLASRGRKPVVAVANALMASAAYWIAAAAADEIVTTPSGFVGSIGVFSALFDESKKFEQEGVTVHLLKAGKYKAEGFPGLPVTAEAKAHMQGLIDESYASFTRAVAKGRGVPVASVRDGYGEGRALSAKSALEAGLVDRIETLDAVIKRLSRGSASGAGGRAELEDVVLEGTGAADPVGVLSDAVEPVAAAGEDLELQAWALRLR